MGVLDFKGAPSAGTALYALDDLGDLEDPQTRSFDFGEGSERFAMFIMHYGSEVRGYLNRCPHAGHPLDFPEHQILTLDKSLLRCASHGAQFERDSGTCVSGPCEGRALVPVPVHVKDGMICVGEAAGDKNGA